MAMNQKPKPLRPNPLKATLRGESGNAKPVVKVVPKKPLTKPAVKNPSAPSAAGPRGSVRVMTKSETAMKKGKVKPDKSNAKNATPPGRNRSMTSEEKYKRPGATQKMIDNTQGFRGRTPRGGGGLRGGGGIGGGLFGTKNR